MEKKSKKNSHHIKKEKEESPDISQKTKIMYQSKTTKNFNKIKNTQKIVEDLDEHEIENESMKQMYLIDNGKNQINQIPIKNTVNWKGMKSIYDNNILQKNVFYSNLNNSNNNNSNNNSSVKNLKKNNKKFPFSAVKKENQKYIMKNYITEKLSKNSKSINNININISNNDSYRIEKDNLVNNLNNIVIENKKKIKQNQGKLNNLIKLIKNKDKDPDNLRRNNEEKENFEKSKENMTQQVFRYTKKFPQKNNEVQNKIEKNEFIQNLKKIQMKKQNTSKPNISSCNNFIINGLNQIYKKSFTKGHDDKFNNYILNDEDNTLYKFNENKLYPNRLFSSTTNMKNSESVNNMRIRISINEKKPNRVKKDNIYVNKIKSSKDNNYSNINNRQITDESNSIKIDKKINNLNYINIDCMNSNKNTIENNNIITSNQFQIHSPKSIYIPKKATSFRGMSQENIHNFKRKNDNPIIYHKKIEINNIYNNKYSNNNSKNENDYYFYFFNSEKRNSNKNSFTYKNNDYNNENNLRRNGRATYSRKYSVKKQNYCWQNNNSFDDKMTIKNNYKKENNNSDNKADFFNNINDVFENEIDDISSIKINSSYDSCTIDYENNINRIKFPFVNENENNTEKKKSQNNFQIYKNNGGNKDNINNFNYMLNNEDDFNNNIKMKKSIGTSVKNKNNINRIKVLLNQKKDKFNKGESKINNSSNKKSVRFNNRDKKFDEKNYIPNFQNIKFNDKNKDFYASTTYSFYNKKKNNVKDNNINQNK